MPFCLYVCLNFCVDNVEYDSFTDGISIERIILFSVVLEQKGLTS